MAREGSLMGKAWGRAAVLMVLTGMLSVLHPGVLIGVPLLLLALWVPPRRRMSLALGLLLAVVIFGGGPGSGLWYVERAWALILGGWFIALTLRWPRESFLARGLGAVGGSFAAMALLFWVNPGEWPVVAWAVKTRLEAGMGLAIQALRASMGPEAVSPGFEARALDAMAFQGVIFPALLGLGSLTGLGCSWWIHLRLARSEDVGIGPLRGFRFNDQMVWVLILGLGALLGSSGQVAELGTNAVVFMGALYALRGVAVVLFLTGGPTLLGGILLALAFFLVAPLLVGGAFIIGLGDTWLNLRARRKGEQPS